METRRRRDIRYAPNSGHTEECSRKGSPHRDEASSGQDQRRTRGRCIWGRCNGSGGRPFSFGEHHHATLETSWPQWTRQHRPPKPILANTSAHIPHRASASPRCSGRRCGPGLRRHGREGISHDRIVVVRRMAEQGQQGMARPGKHWQALYSTCTTGTSSTTTTTTSTTTTTGTVATGAISSARWRER